jgi:hypothetical protein
VKIAWTQPRISARQAEIDRDNERRFGNKPRCRSRRFSHAFHFKAAFNEGGAPMRFPRPNQNVRRELRESENKNATDSRDRRMDKAIRETCGS